MNPVDKFLIFNGTDQKKWTRDLKLFKKILLKAKVSLKKIQKRTLKIQEFEAGSQSTANVRVLYIVIYISDIVATMIYQ